MQGLCFSAGRKRFDAAACILPVEAAIAHKEQHAVLQDPPSREGEGKLERPLEGTDGKSQVFLAVGARLSSKLCCS